MLDHDHTGMIQLLVLALASRCRGGEARAEHYRGAVGLCVNHVAAVFRAARVAAVALDVV